MSWRTWSTGGTASARTTAGATTPGTPASPARATPGSAMSPENPLPPELAAALERLDDLVAAFEQHPDPDVRERAVALLQCVDHVHRGGLRRLAELLRLAGLEPPALADPG